MTFDMFTRRFVPIRVHSWFYNIKDKWSKITAWWFRFRNY